MQYVASRGISAVFRSAVCPVFPFERHKAPCFTSQPQDPGACATVVIYPRSWEPRRVQKLAFWEASGETGLLPIGIFFYYCWNFLTHISGSRITADGDCSHEVKRYLILGRKTLINLDSILKSRDVTLPTKIHLVKTIICPVVIYGCESWTIKKAEHWRIDAVELWCWRRPLRVPWTARRSNQSILREIGPGCSLEEMMLKLKLQYFGHLMRRFDSLEKTLMLGGIGGRRRRGRQRMRWLDGITDSMDVSLSELR